MKECRFGRHEKFVRKGFGCESKAREEEELKRMIGDRPKPRKSCRARERK